MEEQKGINVQLAKRIDTVESTLNKRIDGLETSLNKKIDNLQYSVTRITNLLEVQEKEDSLPKHCPIQREFMK